MSVRVSIRGYGGPEVLEFEDVDPPAPGPGEIRIDNRAIGVNPSDWKMVGGNFKDFVEVEFPFVPGSASTGVVDLLGDGVTRFAIGDEVIAQGFGGAYQRFRIVAADEAVAKPASIDFYEAAALPSSATTGYVLVDQLGIGPQDTLLIHGGAGGVGSVAVQVARLRGATVIATASARNHDYLRELGALPVAYGDGLVDAVRTIGTVTAVADAFGGADSVAATQALLDDMTRTVTAVTDGFSIAAGIPAVDHRPEALAAVTDLAADGALRIRVADVWSLQEAERALELSRDGHLSGKLVLRPD